MNGKSLTFCTQCNDWVEITHIAKSLFRGDCGHEMRISLYEDMTTGQKIIFDDLVEPADEGQGAA